MTLPVAGVGRVRASASAFLSHSEGNHVMQRKLALPGRRRAWLAVTAPAVAAFALSLVPLAASHAAVTTVKAATAAPAATALPVLTLKLNGKTVAVGGTLKSGAERVITTVTYNSTNGGAQPSIVRLDPGVTYPQFFAAAKKVIASQDPDEFYGIAQVVFDAQANTGTSTAQVDFAPGLYAVTDVGAPTPSITTFTITRASKPLPLPKPGATVSTIDFGFTGPGTLTDGELVRWQNSGFVVHMIIGIQAPSQAVANQIAALLKAGKDSQAQALATGFYGWDGGLSHGQGFESVVSQPAGFWVIACFMDTQDHREHTTLGMEKVIQIVR